MWILLLLRGFLVLMIGGGVSADADSQGDGSFDCTVGLLKCDSYRISLSERISSEFLIEGPTELRRKCQSLEPFFECMEEAAWRCEQTDATPADEAIIKSGEFLRLVCLDHNGLKKDFLNSTACINKHWAGTYLSCKPEEIFKNITAFHTTVKSSCEYQKALLECRRNSIDKQCGEEVGDFYTQIMTLELNLDYLCEDEINTRAPHKFTSDVIDVFISILIDLIRPVFHVMSDLSPVKSRDALVHELEKIVSQLWPPPKKEELKENFGGEGTCSGARQEKTKPEMNLTDLRRYGNLPPKVAEKMKEEIKVNFNTEMEVLIALKSYKAALTEFAQYNRATQGRSMSDVDNCDDGECGHRRSDSLYKKPAAFDYKPTGTYVQDIGTLLYDLETKVGSKLVKKQRNRIEIVEDVFKFSESSKSKGDREMKINYVLIGGVYLPLEINYSDGYQDYSHHEDVKVSDKKILLTPSTQTVPSMSSEDVVGSTKVLISDVRGIEECDKEQD